MGTMARLPHSRTITLAGFVADPDPNTTPPPAANVWGVAGYITGATQAIGNALTGAFNTNETAGTVSLVVWWFEEASGQWFILDESESLKHRRRIVTTDIKSAVRLFVQVLSFGTTGAATTFTLRGGAI